MRFALVLLLAVTFVAATAHATQPRDRSDLAVAFEETAEGYRHCGPGFDLLIAGDAIVLRLAGSEPLRIVPSEPFAGVEGIEPLGGRSRTFADGEDAPLIRDAPLYRAVRQGPLEWRATVSGFSWRSMRVDRLSWTIEGADAVVLGGDRRAILKSPWGTVTVTIAGADFRAAAGATLEVEVDAPKRGDLDVEIDGREPRDSGDVRLAVNARGYRFVATSGTTPSGRPAAVVTKLAPDDATVIWTARLAPRDGFRLDRIEANSEGLDVFGQDAGGPFVASISSEGTRVSVAPTPRIETVPGFAVPADIAARWGDRATIQSVGWEPGGTVSVAGTTLRRTLPGATIVGPGANGANVFLATVPPSPESPRSAGCPGTINFDGGGGTGLWTTPANWDLDRLPEPLDDVCIGPDYSVFILSGTQNVQSLATDATARLTLAGGTLKLEAFSFTGGNFTMSSGTLTGAGDLDVAGALAWNGGTMSGTSTTRANGSLSVGGSSPKVLNQRFLVNNGVATWSGTGNILVSEFSSITNNGTWIAQGNAEIARLAPGGPFINEGTFRRSGSTGTATIGVELTSHGSVETQSGTLSINGTGFATGTFTGAAGATLRFHIFGAFFTLGSASQVTAPTVLFDLGSVFVHGTYAPTTGTTIAPDGRPTFYPEATVQTIGSQLTFSGGIATFNSGEEIKPSTMTFSGGTLYGSDTLRISGLLTWTGGGFSGTGLVDAQGGMELGTSANLRSITGRLLRTSGTTHWTGSGEVRLGGGASIENVGTWDAQGDGLISATTGGGSVANSGTFRKSGGATATTIAVLFSQTGLVEVSAKTLAFTNGFVQTLGTTTQAGGALSSTTPLDIRGGSFRGTGIAAASMTNAATVAPGLSPGILGVNGSYAQGQGGQLAVEIGGTSPGSQHDRLDIAGSATLGGTLDVSLAGDYTAAAGDLFTILTAGGVTGTFVATNLPPIGPLLDWSVIYTAQAVQLQIVAAPSGRIPGDLDDEPPLTVDRNGGNLTLAWAPGCLGSDTDAEVYEGVVGNFESHVPITCSTNGAASWTFSPGAGGRYYLVVPTNGVSEGSYGTVGSGAPRPASSAACRVHRTASCP